MTCNKGNLTLLALSNPYDSSIFLSISTGINPASPKYLNAELKVFFSNDNLDY